MFLKLEAGDALELMLESDNPHDPGAVAVKYKGMMHGYVPGDQNGPLTVMMHFGHADVFEYRVLQIAPEHSPWHQVRPAAFVTDRR